jgi:seryl-tRNA synthetase
MKWWTDLKDIWNLDKLRESIKAADEAADALIQSQAEEIQSLRTEMVEVVERNERQAETIEGLTEDLDRLRKRYDWMWMLKNAPKPDTDGLMTTAYEPYSARIELLRICTTDNQVPITKFIVKESDYSVRTSPR